MDKEVSGDQFSVRLDKASLVRGGRKIWQDLDVDIRPGEFIAVLGPNGAGKTTLLKVLLGRLPLSQGNVQVLGEAPTKGSPHIGYIPQQKSFDTDIPIRGRDLVQFGITGASYGLGKQPNDINQRVQEAITAVGAGTYADMPLGLLSGGEQQRLRVAQALVGEPDILLCDEPLLSLDIASQHVVTKLIDDYRRSHHASIIFVTHEVNPVLQYVDRILYLAGGHWLIDTPDAVLQSEKLSELYGSNVEVVRLKNRVLVLDAEGPAAGEAHHEHGAEI